jgi:LacI family transcriptional regulator
MPCALLEAAPGALLLDNPGDPSFSQVYESFCFDDYTAVKMGVRHLLDCGKNKVLLMNGFADHHFSEAADKAYREILADHNIEVDKSLILNSDYTPEGAYRSIREALDRGLVFDAVFTNDEMAFGVYRALQERGIKIPHDVAVCGCDNISLGRHLYPSLTTVKLNYEKLGQTAVEHLFNNRRLSTKEHRVKIAPELEIRESTESMNNE